MRATALLDTGKVLRTAGLRAVLRAASSKLRSTRPGIAPSLEDPRLRWEPHRLVGQRPSAIRAWLAENPPGSSPGWDEPLECAMRIWNIWLAFGADELPNLRETFLAHRRVIAERLEDRGLVIGSHLLGELLGLYVCDAALGNHAGRRAAHERLAEECERQILSDGGGAEGSTGYTRFVTELCLAATIASHAAGDHPVGLWAARRGIAFLEGVMTPDGSDPAIGDDDDSIVIPRPSHDARSIAELTATGRAILNRQVSKSTLTNGDHAPSPKDTPLPPSFAAPRFGLLVARGQPGDMLVMRAGPHGQDGIGGHAHNDALSFSLWFGGAPVVIDPGTGVYLGRPALRDRFRGVLAHATLCVDGLEPSEVLESRPFALPDDTRAKIEVHEPNAWRAIGVHHGYQRLGVLHRREILFDRQARRVVVLDRVDGSGCHELCLSFPLPREAQARTIRTDDASGLTNRLVPAMRSPRYGESVDSVALRRVGKAQLPVTLRTVFTA